MTLPTIEVDGVTIKPSFGKYTCPHKCGDKFYGLRSWKTEKGIRKHMAECPHGEGAKTKKMQAAIAYGVRQREILETHAFKHKPGDIIAFVHRTVVKPMNDSRGRRIRYEEVCRFLSIQTTVIETAAGNYYGDVQPAYRTNAGLIFERDVLTKEEADAKAAADQKAHDEHLAFSSFCR